MAETKRPADPADWLEEPKKLSETLNVITILTFVGSGIAILRQIYSFYTAQAAYDKMQQLDLNNAPGILKAFLPPDPVGSARNVLENRVPLLVLAIVGAGLCIYGALLMRQMKKIGLPIYIVGELLPFAAIFLFIGWLGWLAMFTSIIFSALFIILYLTQRKYLTN